MLCARRACRPENKNKLKDSVVIRRDSTIISTLWRRDRFIKVALAAFITSIIEANPILFPPVILEYLTARR